ncbi:MAG: hypothetical protein F6K48_03090 [Okeania sp. SIO3H1]|nr:hypothetical protein [Okeania sp. SIO3H1]
MTPKQRKDLQSKVAKAFDQMGGAKSLYIKRLHGVMNWIKEKGLVKSNDHAGARNLAFMVLAKARCNIITMRGLSRCSPPLGDWFSLLALLHVGTASENTALEALIGLANDPRASVLETPQFKEIDWQWREACSKA